MTPTTADKKEPTHLATCYGNRDPLGWCTCKLDERRWTWLEQRALAAEQERDEARSGWRTAHAALLASEQERDALRDKLAEADEQVAEHYQHARRWKALAKRLRGERGSARIDREAMLETHAELTDRLLRLFDTFNAHTEKLERVVWALLWLLCARRNYGAGHPDRADALGAAIEALAELAALGEGR